jgi:hypothetical protein
MAASQDAQGSTIAGRQVLRHPPLREVVALVGRHAVRLRCGHVETLFAGEAEAIGRKVPCERCAAVPKTGAA